MSEPWHECPICRKRWPPGPGVVKPCDHSDEEWREYRRTEFDEEQAVDNPRAPLQGPPDQR